MPSRSRVEGLTTRRRALQLAGASAMAALSTTVAHADTYPDRPITCVLPLPPGSPLDTIGRIVSERLRKDLGYPFVLENVAGAVSNIGTARVAHAAPDGYTLLLTVNSPVAINAFLYKDMPFDAEKDLAPVILTSFSPVALAVHNSFPAHTMQEFIAYAKAHPGEVACGNSGVGSTGQLCAAYLTSLTGINLNIIPYKGTPETTADLIGGHIQSAFTALGLVTEQAKAGVLRILAVTSDDRISLAPDVPTIRETVPEFANAPAAWHGIFAPSRTPASVIDIINREANLALQDPETIALLTRSFLTPAGGTPEVLAKRTKLEHDVAGTLIKKLGILPQ